AGEEGDDGADFARLAGASERNLREDSGEKVGALHHPGCHISIDEAGMYAIHANSERRHLGGHVARERFEAEFRRRVMRTSGQNLAGLDAADHHHIAFALFFHDAAAVYLRAKPVATEVDVDQARPLIVGEIEEGDDGFDTGVVDEAIDGAELIPHAIDHAFDFGAVGDVGFHRDRAAAFASDFGGDVLGGLCTRNVVHGDIGALFREDFRDPFADSAARSGNERDFSFELHHPSLPFKPSIIYTL